MGVQTTANLESGQKKALEQMVEDEVADTQSEALRRTLNIGLADLGYLNGTPVDNGDTRLRAAARRFTDAFALLGVLLIGVTFFLPLEMRMFVIAPFGAALACHSIDRALASYEPAVSRRLARAFSRGEQA